MTAQSDARVGCAGWSLPRSEWPHFPEAGTHLQRYAARFNAVEINSSFYRSHQRKTYRRWADSVPEDFLFAVKLPKTITHAKRLRDTDAELAAFLEQVAGLGGKLGCLLVQLPPSLALNHAAAQAFFARLRKHYERDIACEPRHASWFDHSAAALLAEYRIARVAADPARVPEAARPGGWKKCIYYRWHGSPRMYYSAYSSADLQRLAQTACMHTAVGTRTWCIFDNTAAGAATRDALELIADLSRDT